MTGAGAWSSPAWYGRGMPLPADAAGKRRARLAMAGVQRVLVDQGLMPDTVKLDVAALVCWSWLYGMDLAVAWVERRVVKDRE